MSSCPHGLPRPRESRAWSRQRSPKSVVAFRGGRPSTRATGGLWRGKTGRGHRYRAAIGQHGRRPQGCLVDAAGQRRERVRLSKGFGWQTGAPFRRAARAGASYSKHRWRRALDTGHWGRPIGRCRRLCRFWLTRHPWSQAWLLAGYLFGKGMGGYNLLEVASRRLLGPRKEAS